MTISFVIIGFYGLVIVHRWPWFRRRSERVAMWWLWLVFGMFLNEDSVDVKEKGRSPEEVWTDLERMDGPLARHPRGWHLRRIARARARRLARMAPRWSTTAPDRRA